MKTGPANKPVRSFYGHILSVPPSDHTVPEGADPHGLVVGNDTGLMIMNPARAFKIMFPFVPLETAPVCIEMSPAFPARTSPV